MPKGDIVLKHSKHKSVNRYHADQYAARGKNRDGDHICYISDLSKLKSHFPSWGLTRYFDDILEEMVEFEMHKLKAV